MKKITKILTYVVVFMLGMITLQTEASAACSQHNMQVTSQVNGTCTQPGYLVYRCNSCGQTEQRYTEPLGHNFNVLFEWQNENTVCYAREVCTRCGYNERRQASMELETYAPTCTVQGKKVYTAKYNGKFETRTTYIPMIDHNYCEVSNVVYKEATCTDSQYNYLKCGMCGQNPQSSDYIKETNPALGHTFENGVCATCGFEEGEKQNANTTVYAEIGSEFTIIIPKHIVIDAETKTGAYTVGVTGDIAGNETVKIIPEESFAMTQSGKSDITASVSQDKTEWVFSEMLENNVIGNGSISVEDLTAGSWSGNFNFSIALEGAESEYKDSVQNTTYADVVYN